MIQVHTCFITASITFTSIHISMLQEVFFPCSLANHFSNLLPWTQNFCKLIGERGKKNLHNFKPCLSFLTLAKFVGALSHTFWRPSNGCAAITSLLTAVHEPTDHRRRLRYFRLTPILFIWCFPCALLWAIIRLRIKSFTLKRREVLCISLLASTFLLLIPVPFNTNSLNHS